MSGSQPKRNKKNNNAGSWSGSTSPSDETDELTKQERQIARFLRLNCPKKQGNLLGMKVDFFVGQKLVDSLLESKWGPKASQTPVFADRRACVVFMQRLMNKQLFYRAVKVYKDSASDTVKEKSSETDATPSKRKKKGQQQTPTATPKPASEETTPSTAAAAAAAAAEVKRKFKLEMADDQKFDDSSEPYVWVYDPTSTKTYIIGSLLILGAIGICLFPLWPSQVREGVYYLSLTGASFLGAILGLAVLKYIIYAFVWAVTLGNVHFWFLPNLTEDVGFFESFVPLYKIDPPKTSGKTDTTAASKKNDDLSESTESSLSKKTSEQASSVLSGSTVEITGSDLMDKSTVRRRKSSASNIREEDGFELVDDDDARAK